VILAAVLLGAHFWRAGNFVLALICVLTPLLFLVKQGWSWLAVQLFAYASVVIWFITTITIVQERIHWGQPWLRVIVILGGVALFSAWAGLLLNSPRVKARYRGANRGG
jgi:hypothetical protein